MKRYYLALLLATVTTVTNAQFYTGTDIAGGSMPYTDGMPATSATINPRGLATDRSGNVFILDGYYVRKINTITGIITTLAGTGTAGYSGDGGPATAAMIDHPFLLSYGGLGTDAAGNVYIADHNNNRVRKIDAISDIITTVAGGGIGGDGSPATSAAVCAQAVAFDAAGNMYISGCAKVRKVNAATGIITTITGTGTPGYSGDGGPASAAVLGDEVTDVKLDVAGNIYINDYDNRRIRKIDVTTGIITTVAGGIAHPIVPPKVFGKPATSHGFSIIEHFSIALDADNLYLADGANGGIQRVDLSTGLIYNNGQMHAIPTYVSTDTAGSIYYTTSDRVAKLAPNIIISSVHYVDNNSNCNNDAADYSVYHPIVTEIDSNGIAVDTISSTSGFHYIAKGKPGDVYTLKVLSAPQGLATACPSTGIATSTLAYHSFKYLHSFGFNCSTVPGFDLTIHTSAWLNQQIMNFTMLLGNNYCTPQPATVTATTAPKYEYNYSKPTISGSTWNIHNWNVGNLTAAAAAPTIISLGLKTPGTTPLYMPGDTVHSMIVINPKTGDANEASNVNIRIDTVRAGFDPNCIEVSPAGFIPSGTELQYTIHFENTGNDTAHNIYVTDQLSEYLDAGTFRMVAASAKMNLVTYIENNHTVARFEFPDINLPDSSHHGLCEGMFVYKIKTRSGLPNGTSIKNKAAIYFDINPAVITNTVENIIGIPTRVPVMNEPNKVHLYPNPATNHLTITTEQNAFTSFTITNNIGQQLIQQQINNEQTVVDVKTLPAGLYYVTLKGENGTKTMKFVKM